MKTVNNATLQFIQAHQAEEVGTIALRGCSDSSVDLPFALQQIAGRQRAKEKFPELYEHDGILYPSTLSLAQSSSSITAKYKSTLLQGDTLADLTGGFGIDTFAFARRFTHCIHVEPQSSLSALAAHNAAVLGLRNIQFIQSTLEETLPSLPKMDYIYIDPSRRDGHGGRVFTPEACSPNLLVHKSQLLQKANIGALVKLSPMIDLKQTLQQLPETQSIHIVSVQNECREILFLLQQTVNEHEPLLTAVNLTKEGDETYTFTLTEEQTSVPRIATKLGTYLYEPNAAILKAGAFKSIGVHYALEKLHTHTHLYTSTQALSHFPGRIFFVEQVLPFNKKSIKTLQGIQANTATRNFPLTAEELKKRLNIRDGGHLYLFGTTLFGDKKCIILARKPQTSSLKKYVFDK